MVLYDCVYKSDGFNHLFLYDYVHVSVVSTCIYIYMYIYIYVLFNMFMQSLLRISNSTHIFLDRLLSH